MTYPVSLPSDRGKDAALFEEVDVDLAGPLCLVVRLLGEACKNSERASQENLRKGHIYEWRIANYFEMPTADIKDLDVRDVNHVR
ncbi:hypothetical protein TNCV_4098001 [Trichonephila clavipes]|nr:hypothetical protein TNCV_4098001 [Trichonephila clavipes]